MSLVELQKAALKRRLEIEAEIGLDDFQEEEYAESIVKAEAKAALKRGFVKPKVDKSAPRRESARIKGITPSNTLLSSTETSSSTITSSSWGGVTRILPPEGDGNALDHVPSYWCTVDQAKALMADVLTGVNGLRQANGCPILNSSTEEILLKPLQKFPYQMKDAPSSTVLFEKTSKFEIKSEKYVVKALPESSNRVYSILFHPSNDRIITCVGGRFGHISLWSPDFEDNKNISKPTSKKAKVNHSEVLVHKEGPDDEQIKTTNNEIIEDDSMKTLATFVLHGPCPINAMVIPTQRPHLLLSAGYDGTIRLTDITNGSTQLIYTDDDAPACLTIDEQSNSGLSFFVGNRSGSVYHLDTRMKSQKTHVYDAHMSKVTAISMRNGSSTFLTSCGGEKKKVPPSVKIWDCRHFSKHGSSSSSTSSSIKPLATLEHSNAISHASFSPNGEWIASVSADDQIRFWDYSTSKASSPTQRVNHDNKTGRWLTTFKSAWDPKAESTLLIGNMKRTIDVYQLTKGGSKPLHDQFHIPESPLATAVPTQIAVHPSLDLVSGGSSSGRCYLWKC